MQPRVRAQRVSALGVAFFLGTSLVLLKKFCAFNSRSDRGSIARFDGKLKRAR